MCLQLGLCKETVKQSELVMLPLCVYIKPPCETGSGHWCRNCPVIDTLCMHMLLCSPFTYWGLNKNGCLWQTAFAIAFLDGIFQCIFLTKVAFILIQISMDFILSDILNSKSYLADTKRVISHCWTHGGRDKMAVIFQTTFSDAFPWMKMHAFYLKFNWNSFLRVQLTISQYWFR